MVAFNFKEGFVPMIESNKKRSTIRSRLRCKAGDTMQLYTGQRTKACRKIKDVTCVAVESFHVKADGSITVSNKTPEQERNLYKQEGFNCHEAMVGFFKEHYGLPYTGFLHEW